MSAQATPGFDPSSFPALISGLGAQAQILMGLMDNPLTGQREAPDLEKASMLINTLDMLDTKTKGNLDPNEEQFLQAILTDLRVRFVELKNA